MTDLVTLPGIGNSGELHWQTLWENADPSIVRFQPARWDQPELADWVAALERAIDAASNRPVLVAHSLSCLLVAHNAPRIASRVAGAFLVGIPDPNGSAFPPEAASFARPPLAPLPFPALVIASSDDPYASLDFARGFATTLKAGFINIGACGHINGDSNLGNWREGRNLLAAFCAGLAQPL